MKIDRRSFLAGSAAALAAGGTVRETLASRRSEKYRVAVIGCGRLGQQYAEIYRAMPDTELAAIAEWNPARRKVVGERFGVKALYRDVNALLKGYGTPDLSVIVTPVKYMTEAVVASAEAGVKGVQTDRPFAARLSDADAMVQTCEQRGVVFSGGGLELAKWEVQEAGRRLKSGEFGKPIRMSMHGYGQEILAGGMGRLLVLQHFTDAKVKEVLAWGYPPEKLTDDATDMGLKINGVFQLTNGQECLVYGAHVKRSFEVWTDEDAVISWRRSHGPPVIYQGRDARGARREIDPRWAPRPYDALLKDLNPLLDRLEAQPTERDYVLAPIYSFVQAVKTGTDPWITGRNMAHTLDVAIASKRSAQFGSVPVKVPLEDRSLALYPRAYRWLGGDVSGRPQSVEAASGKKL